MRKNYAGIGYSYDKQRDAFIPPKPFNSWILNETTCLWEPPILEPMPIEGKTFMWNETIYQNALTNNTDTSAAWVSLL